MKLVPACLLIALLLVVVQGRGGRGGGGGRGGRGGRGGGSFRGRSARNLKKAANVGAATYGTHQVGVMVLWCDVSLSSLLFPAGDEGDW